MFDSGVPGFSTIVMVAKSDLDKLHARVSELLESNTSQVFKRRNAEAEVKAYGAAVSEFMQKLNHEQHARWIATLREWRVKFGVEQ